MPRDRDVNLNVRVRPEERKQLQALAEDRDLTASALIRHMVRAAYARRFGTKPPTRTTAKGGRPMILTTPEQTKAIFDDIIRNGIEPHAEALARIALDGNIAIVTYKPTMEDEATAGRVVVLRGSESGDVIRLTRRRAARIFSGVYEVTRRWMTTRAKADAAKIFLVVELGTFLLNYAPSRGCCWLEPGSTDAKHLS